MDYPLAYYTDEERENLFFHLMDVGEGLMCLVIFPDETTMLFDCNVTDDKEQEVLKYLGRQIPFRLDDETEELAQWIDIFVNSHRDDDHCRGLSKVHDKYPIKSIWDSGQTGATTQSSDYQYYMRPRRSLREKSGENAVIVPKPSMYALRTFGTAYVYCLNSSLEYSDVVHSLTMKSFLEFVEKGVLREGKIQHTNSIVLSINYKGRVLMLPGDSDYLAWRDKIMPNFKNTGLLKTNILVASHHGSRSFFTDETQNDTIDPEENPDTTYIEHIYKIAPSLTLIPCGDYDSAHHPNKEAQKIYKENTAHEQVYTTCNKWTLAGFIDRNGAWTVAPSRFFRKTNINRNFQIKCVCHNNGDQYEGKSGGIFPIGCSLHFSVRSNFGILEPFKKVSVTWEVSNGGIELDHEHQEIYYKGSNEGTPKHSFNREVSYHGTHLLRCFVNNNKKKIRATQVFVVQGKHT
jgi:beta-lactamase superfamily II metal-dependent hydrolase